VIDPEVLAAAIAAREIVPQPGPPGPQTDY
jgi:hypothetical protein